MTIKKVPKKLRGKDELLMVDQQVLRWRKRMKRRGIKLGKGMEYAEKHAEQEREARSVNTEEKLLKKRFF